MNDLSLCFKVVRHPSQDSDMRWSLLAPLKYQVAYKPGRRTTPMVEGSKLYAFASKMAALNFVCDDAKQGIRNDEYVEIWLALAEFAKPCRRVSTTFRFIDADWFDDFWLRPCCTHGEPPPETIECETVTLIQCLERFKGEREPDRIFMETSA